MPKVGKKHFSYGKKGIAAAKQYAKKIGVRWDLKGDKKGGVRKYLKVGKISIPTRDVRGAEDDFPQMNKGVRPHVTKKMRHKMGLK